MIADEQMNQLAARTLSAADGFVYLAYQASKASY